MLYLNMPSEDLLLASILSPLDTTSSRHSEQPVETQCTSNIDKDVYPKKSKVPPPIIIVNVEPMQELVCCRKRAVLADISRRAIEKVATSCLDERTHVVAAGHVTRNSHLQNLIVCTLDIGAPDTSRHDTTDDVSRWRDTVHKGPELGDVLVSDTNTVKVSICVMIE